MVKDFSGVFVRGVQRSAHFHSAIAPAGIIMANAHHSPMTPPAMIAPHRMIPMIANQVFMRQRLPVR